MLTAKKVVPSGLPRCRSVSACSVLSASDVLSRNSCVMAMPIEAKASEVRSQARKVRSGRRGRVVSFACSFLFVRNTEKPTERQVVARHTPLVLKLDALKVAQPALPLRPVLLLPPALPVLACLARRPVGRRLPLLSGRFPALGGSPARRGARLGRGEVVEAAHPLGLLGHDAGSVEVVGRGRVRRVAQAALAAEQRPQPRTDVGGAGSRLGSLAGTLGGYMHVSDAVSRGVARVAWGYAGGRTTVQAEAAGSVRTVKEKMVFVEGPKMASARRAMGLPTLHGLAGWAGWCSRTQSYSAAAVRGGSLVRSRRANKRAPGTLQGGAGSFKAASQHYTVPWLRRTPDSGAWTVDDRRELTSRMSWMRSLGDLVRVNWRVGVGPGECGSGGGEGAFWAMISQSQDCEVTQCSAAGARCLVRSVRGARCSAGLGTTRNRRRR